MKVIMIQKVIRVILVIMITISFGNDNSDNTYDRSCVLLIQAFLKGTIFDGVMRKFA